MDAPATHALPAMLEDGLNVSVHSDDPAYFGSYVNDCLLRCHSQLGMNRSELAALARNGLQAAFVPAVQTARWIDDLDADCR